jgi:hypothetical protein
MTDWLVVVAVIANFVIAGGYAGIGAWIVPKFDIAAPSAGLRATKVAGGVFFFTCAITHADMAFHAMTNTPMSYTEVHYILNHVIQAIAAPAFLILASRYMAIRIMNRRHYVEVLDRRIQEVEIERERLVKEAVREAGDVTSDVWRALGTPSAKKPSAPSGGTS